MSDSYRLPPLSSLVKPAEFGQAIEDEMIRLNKEINTLKQCLGTLIAWQVQDLGKAGAQQLLDMIAAQETSSDE